MRKRKKMRQVEFVFKTNCRKFTLTRSSLSSQVQTTTMCISVSLSGSVVLGCLFAPKVHIILFQPQKNVASLRVTANRFSATVSASASAPSSSYSKGTGVHYDINNSKKTSVHNFSCNSTPSNSLGSQKRV